MFLTYFLFQQQKRKKFKIRHLKQPLYEYGVPQCPSHQVINQNMVELHFQSFEFRIIIFNMNETPYKDLPILLSINFNPNTFATSHYTNIVFSICSVLIALISKTILLYFMHTKQLQSFRIGKLSC